MGIKRGKRELSISLYEQKSFKDITLEKTEPPEKLNNLPLFRVPWFLNNKATTDLNMTMPLTVSQNNIKCIKCVA